MAHLLLAEDDDGIRVPLVRALEREGHDVEAFADGREAAAAATAGQHALLVLDIGLPGLDGLEVCRLAREARPEVPILFLTARDGELDVIDGLDAGADDYVTKPFSAAVLLARVRAQLRRAEPDHLQAGEIVLAVSARRAWQAETELQLSAKEFDLLVLLVREAGRVVTRERVMAEVWDENWFGSTKTLDMHVSWLRKKLGDDASNPRHLITVRGVGLRFEP